MLDLKKSLIFAACITLIQMAAIAQNGTTTLSTPVGAGTNSPNGTLHLHQTVGEPNIIGEGHIRDNPELPDIYTNTFLMTNTATGSSSSQGFIISQVDGEVTIKQQQNDNLYIFGYNGTGLTIDNSGRLGIGAQPASGKTLNVGGNSSFVNNVAVGNELSVTVKTTTAQLHVTDEAYVVGPFSVGNGFSCSSNGLVKAKEINVTLDGWSDFVFEDGYSMPSLGELEQYIKSHRHLPGIPSAEDVENNGVDIGKTNALLLQKIEELTLYIIDLQKQIDELKKQRQ